MPKLNGKHFAYTKKGYAAYRKAKAKKKKKKSLGSIYQKMDRLLGASK
tara:strand:+ start:73 stop:216 length:144 start_codon:yes stop_codon:yes gene_type:complete